MPGYKETIILLAAFLVSVVFQLGIRPLAAWAEDILPGATKIKLPNGLTAVIKETDRAPVAAVQVWVRAGSSYETDREAGITHLIEHMIFKGTKKRGRGELARAIESIGGSINAYTSLDYTVYHCEVPSRFLGEAIDVLSDAVLNSNFEPDELAREKDVVLEEMKMRKDMPTSALFDLLMETSYEKYPYRRPVIGFVKTVKSFTRQDIMDYMAKRYRPENIHVVIAGNVNTREAARYVRNAFKTLKTSREKADMDVIEPLQDAPRAAVKTMDIHEGHLAIAFSGAPGFNDPRAPVLDVLAALLGGGNSSRLNRSIKEDKQLVYQIDSSAFTPLGPGLFEVTAILAPEKTRDALTAILTDIYRLRTEAVGQEELNRAKIQVETDFIYAQETMEGEAQKLGLFETMAGDPSAQTTYLERVKSITPRDIQRVATDIFKTKNINIAMVMPNWKAPKITKKDLTAIIKCAEAVAAASPIKTHKAPMGFNIKETTLSNGVTILVREVRDAPTFAVRAVFPGGVRYETEDTAGLFNFLARAWTKGTRLHNAQELAALIEGIGGEIDGFSGQNSFGLEGRFLSDHLGDGLSLFAEILLNPIFPDEEIKKLQPLLIAGLKRQEDSLPSVAVREFRRELFKPHPYSLNPLGTETSIMGITSERLAIAYNDFARPDRAIISIAGDVNPDEVTKKLKAYLEKWGAGKTLDPPTLPTPQPLDSPRTVTVKKQDKQQLHIVLGFPGVTFKSSERYAVEVLNAVLAGQGGRLFTELRDKKALAYSVTSFVGLGIDYGSFALYIACAPQKKEEAIKGLWQEIEAVRNGSVSPEELERAKMWLIGNYENDLQTNGAQAMDMALNKLYGLGAGFARIYPKEIKKVTIYDVRQAAVHYLNPERYVLVEVGP
ncbi:M16 family metallopeptidase [Dissulfurimicrobium hydrothermale]|uniref:M16 family metallopeptidase n=1 Tax=Dissulfurimicrobium hydrothermale TaxID=1750598 RepID=UPI001EDBE5FB|nr:pitrilysin family protein [Dissulfurimicrobium hydrothermale]UKL14206.1 insulinase family protein [Dissulfurimicrobium hydrothermale]